MLLLVSKSLRNKKVGVCFSPKCIACINVLSALLGDKRSRTITAALLQIGKLAIDQTFS